MKISPLAFLSLSIVSAAAWAAPKPDGTVRQTAQPWTGDAAIFDTPGRAKKLELPRVYQDLGIKSGTKVADIGAGGGWLTMYLGLQVGPTGRIYAEDVLPKYTAYIDRRAKLTGLSNVQTVLGTFTDPKLPGNTLDVAVILNAYHEFDEPLAMLTKIRAATKRGGRLGILERDTDELRREANAAYTRTGKILHRVDELNDKNPMTDDHRLALPIVKREGEKAGWKFVSARELGDDNYLAVFEAP